MFEIDIDPEQTREKSWAASYWEIANTAVDIIVPCISPEPHLGGITKVGRDHVLDLNVFGLAADECSARRRHAE